MVSKIGNSKSILITGGTSGLGLALVKHFLSEGYDVYATGRDLKSFRNPDNRFHFIKVDLTDLRQVSEEIQKLNEHSIDFETIINNAGVLGQPEFTKTRDGFEYTFQVNFLSHLLIDEMIVRNKKKTLPLTIISISTPVSRFFKPSYEMAAEESYRSFKSYAESKIYLLMIGAFLANKYPDKNLRYFGLDPGTFRSGISRTQKKWFKNMYSIAAPFMRSPEKVAKRLEGVMKGSEIHNGVVFRKMNRHVLTGQNDKESEEHFLTKWYNMIEKFLG